MSQVLIKGKKYVLGGMCFSEENLDLFDELMSLSPEEDKADKTDKAMTPEESATTLAFMRNIHRVMKECLIDGNGEEKGTEAMRGLTFSLKKGTDLSNCLNALMASIAGK